MQTLTSVWYHDWQPRNEDTLETHHGRILRSMVKGLRRTKMIDLGCGGKGVAPLFKYYKGIDLPEFNVYISDLDFLQEYELVLMNAFIDVMQFPLDILERVLEHCKGYVLIHRQEFTTGKTRVTEEHAYGGWTHHSIINHEDFAKVSLDFNVEKYVNLNFDNWENGGNSVLLKKIHI